MPFNKHEKIAVALSGGVDSSVCALLLREKGFDVHGVVMMMSDAHMQTVESAKKAAEQLCVPLDVIDARERFDRFVIEPFCKNYCEGRTPNPCVICNPSVKFNLLSEFADSIGAAKIATGHYAHVENVNGHAVIKRALSLERDQSYMLYRLSAEVLGRLVLPLADMGKNSVREYAFAHALDCARAPDSQENCFIPDNDYAGYIRKRGFQSKKGRLISPDGVVLGAHGGVDGFTVGQRRGLGVSLGRPAFVKKICENGDVMLGFSGDEFASSITLGDCVFSPAADELSSLPLSIKIRSAAKCVGCSLSGDGGLTTVKFDTPQRAAAPGQSAVLYRGDYLIGGGFIDDFE